MNDFSFDDGVAFDGAFAGNADNAVWEVVSVPGYTVDDGLDDTDSADLLRADDDGMSGMLPVLSGETVDVTDIAPLQGFGVFGVSNVIDFGATLAMVDGDAAIEVDGEIDGSEPVEPVAELTDSSFFICSTMAMERDVAEQMAALYARLTSAPMRLVPASAVAGKGGEWIIPGAKVTRAQSAATPRVARVAADKPVRAEKVAIDWAQYDAREVCKGGNLSNVKVWQNIRDHAAADDIDWLRAQVFAGSLGKADPTGNTYTKNNGEFLQAMIGAAENRIAVRKAMEERAIADRESALDNWFTIAA